MATDAHHLKEHAHHENAALHNKAGERRTRWVIYLTAAMMIGELILGYTTGSLALTADGWHMGTHVGALGLTLVAYWYARRHAGNDAFSFGTGKIYALAGFTSGILLAVVATHMVIEGVEHLIENPKVAYLDALFVACIGLGVNLVSAYLLSRDHSYDHGHGHGHGHGHDHADHDDHDHAGHDHAATRDKPKVGSVDFNLRAAYIHILADAMTSLLAVVALALGQWLGWWFLDPIMGMVGAGVILWWTLSLCRQAMGQLLDVVSSPQHEKVVRQRLESIDDVRISDLHVWELGPGRRSCIVALVTATPRDLAYYRDAVLTALNVAHLTIEIHQCELSHEDPHRLQPAHHHEH
ncbi:MAG: CDF family Co(II)/Ni(II) efflux transporter DmeF [Proteobacteria bacterium]|nr:CDF family Co(II)/Ni(II) efflux transporter DmeF [Pseudomonadota bacterium]